MDKFTKTQNNNKKDIIDNNILYKNDYMQLKKNNDYVYVIESDSIVVLPYIKDEGYVYLRLENIPPWIEKYQNNINSNITLETQFLTVISGTIENGETPEQTLRRELYEESGIVLNHLFQFDIEGPYFSSKSSTYQFYVCLLELNYTDYKMMAPTGDGSNYEKKAKTIKVSIADLDQIKINDMTTKFLIEKLKSKYSL